MKKLSVAFMTALTCLAITTACDRGDDSATLSVVVSLTAESPSGLRITTYEYSDKGTIIGEKQTLNTVPVYEITDFDYSSGLTRYRTSHNPDGTTTRHKMVTSYLYDEINERQVQVETLKEYLLTGPDADETKPENTYQTYTSADQTQLPQGYKHTNKQGEVVLQRSNFDYSAMSSGGATPSYSYVETGSSVPSPQRLTLVYENVNLRNYTLYSSSVDDTEKGIRVETRENHPGTDNTVSFTITVYPKEEGATPIATKYTYTYENKTFTF
ncbi:MAG: hypothetical protein LBR57_03855 [Alistipes sp.]|nr:hypothetical protein [Alistipes sp.]